MKKSILVVVIILLVAVIVVGAVKTGFWKGIKGPVATSTQVAVACTEEAKQCPDGSYVGRKGPKCEFEECPVPVRMCEGGPCPTNSILPISDWKTYRNEKYGFEFKYPENRIIDDSRGDSIWVTFPAGYMGGRGGSLFHVDIRSSLTLQGFINEYNTSDMLGGNFLSKIIKQENYQIDGIIAKKLTGTTALGLDREMVFVERGKYSYIITFSEGDRNNSRGMASSFKFLD